MADCSPEVLATSILQQRPSIVQTNSMLQQINKQIKGQKFFAHMTEIRGEAVHVCARKILKYKKGKKLKTTIKPFETPPRHNLFSGDFPEFRELG